MRIKNAIKAFEMLLNIIESQKQNSRKDILLKLREENYSIYNLIWSATVDSDIRDDINEIEKKYGRK